MNKQIIGFSGFARSGKDTAGQYLVSSHGFVRVSFADAVRDALLALNPLVCITPEESKQFDNLMGIIRLDKIVQRFDWERAKQCTEIRELLQRTGTELGREIIGETVWTDIAERKAKLYDRVCFTDVRFPNEAELVKNLGGIVVRINRDGVTSINSHVSDKRLPDECIDLDLNNNGTIEDLHDLLNEVVKALNPAKDSITASIS